MQSITTCRICLPPTSISNTIYSHNYLYFFYRLAISPKKHCSIFLLIIQNHTNYNAYRHINNQFYAALSKLFGKY